jgi:GNAT superfamily N-acetyltransferase
LNVTSQPFKREDFLFVERLIHTCPEWMSEEEYPYEGLQAFLKSFDALQGTWSVWYLDSEKVAFSFYVERAPSNNRPWIGTILVEESYRSKGIGKRIMKCLFEDLQNRGHKIAYAAVPIQQNNWIRFLSCCGFEQFKLEKDEEKTYLLFVKPLEEE